MTLAEAKKALEEFRQSLIDEGYEDEEEIDMEMLATLGGMFVEDEIDVNQLNVLMGLVGEGYELQDNFLKLSTEEQKANLFNKD